MAASTINDEFLAVREQDENGEKIIGSNYGDGVDIIAPVSLNEYSSHKIWFYVISHGLQGDRIPIILDDCKEVTQSGHGTSFACALVVR